ncbi:hypothetical protein [Streptomyces murinus]|uniref:hypothetical protein n=1 Tax=Streptomyces murinus TaxID=33900 RepID=UPI0021148B97|nr:hypothetical protein [Streptomyces murinus]
MHRYHGPDGAARRVFGVTVNEAEKKALLLDGDSDRDEQIRCLVAECLFDEDLEDLLEFQPAAVWDDSRSGWPMAWVGLLLDIGCVTNLPWWWPSGEWVMHAGFVLFDSAGVPLRRFESLVNARPVVEMSRGWTGDCLARLRKLHECAEKGLPLEWALELLDGSAP